MPDDFHGARSEHGSLVESIQHRTGLPDDSFGVTAGGHLLVEAGGMSGGLSRREREGVLEAAREHSYPVRQVRGALVVETGRGSK